jgi:hypothetical protein
MESRTRTQFTPSQTRTTSEIEFDEPRLEGKVRPTLYIGPPRQLGGHLLEVMVELIPPRGMHIFHVMPARQKHLDRMGKDP